MESAFPESGAAGEVANAEAVKELTGNSYIAIKDIFAACAKPRELGTPGLGGQHVLVSNTAKTITATCRMNPSNDFGHNHRRGAADRRSRRSSDGTVGLWRMQGRLRERRPEVRARPW